MDPPEYASATATKALQKELMRIKRTMEETPEKDRGWRLDMSDIRNLYQWVVHIVEFDPSLPLAKDLAKFNLSNEGVTLEVRFSPEYPIAPPYIRVVKPRMLQHIEGGGGHVTAGGSICMDLLTTSGWLPSYTIESALLQVRMALTSPHPPARVHPTRWRESYSPFEAMEAFVRVAGMHGWAVPANWRTYFGK
ncbi:UBC-like protein [Gonapodya prolifera JEL478]|uniref:UBC-like protein n=1 Tax=Gonapodya prolifera (strain JEL478) TaxID=1344416 RepID=A0A139AD69_GONPJ|nr:UBC-like protein [Gonapodya prolifera JEL478]|eukprot:KXS14363.1 UBC-like protein [Gonapodya prolifera JEL478]